VVTFAGGFGAGWPSPEPGVEDRGNHRDLTTVRDGVNCCRGGLIEMVRVVDNQKL
jgi:hypothetical protein